MTPLASRPLPLDHPRIMGLETEYSPIATDQERQLHINVQNLLCGLPRGLSQESTFLSNGGRFYVDTGSHPEYATPECLTGASVAVAAKAGEVIVAHTLGKHLQRQGLSTSYKLFKRTVDQSHASNAVGDHENYFTTRCNTPESVAEWLGPHLVSRIIFTGPGMIRRSGRFSLDQRTWHMDDVVYGSGSTAQQRPFVLSRNEMHTGIGNRVQVISGSANILHQPISFRFDSTSLVLRLIEHRMLPGWLQINRPARAMKKIADDDVMHSLALRRKVELAGGRQLTAAQLQYEYASRAVKLGDAGYLNDYDKQFALRWIAMSQDAIDGKIDKWQDQIEWLIKRVVIEQYTEGRGEVSNDRLRQLDSKMHELPMHGTKTIMGILAEKGTIQPLPAAAVAAAVLQAPDDTRARVRGSVIAHRAAHKSTRKAVGQMNWHAWREPSPRYQGQAEQTETLANNPYTTRRQYAAVTTRKTSHS